MRKSLYNFLLPVVLIIASCNASRTQTKEPATTKRVIEEKNFVFRAQSANPMRGRVRNLTNEWELTVRGDSIISYLPYFGRAYNAPINPGEGGINFTSIKSVYTVSEKTGKWEISIKPIDAEGIQEMNLDVFENGQASLRVTLLNKSPISFNGYIVEGTGVGKKAF